MEKPGEILELRGATKGRNQRTQEATCGGKGISPPFSFVNCAWKCEYSVCETSDAESFVGGSVLMEE